MKYSSSLLMVMYGALITLAISQCVITAQAQAQAEGQGVMVWELIDKYGGPSPRYGASMVRHKNHLVVFGGTDGTQTFGDLYSFDLIEYVWSQHTFSSGLAPSARAFHTAEVVTTEGGEDLMFVFGGEHINSPGNTSLVDDGDTLYVLNIDAAMLSWRWVAKPLEIEGTTNVRTRAASASIGDGYVVIHGGIDNTTSSHVQCSPDTLLMFFDETDEKWILQNMEPDSPPVPPRSRHQGSFLRGDGGHTSSTCLFTGGATCDGHSLDQSNTFLDAGSSDMWTSGTAMPIARAGHLSFAVEAPSPLSQAIIVVGGEVGLAKTLSNSVLGIDADAQGQGSAGVWFAPNVTADGRAPVGFSDAAGAGDMPMSFVKQVYVFGGRTENGLSGDLFILHTNRSDHRVCPDACSGHGTCNSKTGICQCFDQWRGPSCAQKKLPCPHNCFYPTNGFCDENNGKCICHDGFSGADCSIPPGSFIIPLIISVVVFLIAGGAFSVYYIMKNREVTVSIYARVPGEDVGGKSVEHAELGILSDAEQTASKRTPRMAGDM